MNTPTQSNTLPAIRALLWERWRVMRWVVLSLSAFYMLVFQMTWMVSRDLEDASGSIGDLHAAMFPAIVSLSILAYFAQRRDGSGLRFGFEERTFRLPVSNRLLVVSSLFNAHLWMFALTLALVLVNAILWPTLPVPLEIAIVSVLIGSIFISGLQLWFTAGLNEYLTLPLFFVLPVTIVQTGEWMPIGVGAALAAGAGIAACTGGVWFQALRRSGHLATAYARLSLIRLIPSSPERMAPRLRHPVAMLCWYEWRRWGWILSVLVILSVVIPRALEALPLGVENAGVRTTGWVIVIAFSVGVGAVHTYHKTHPASQTPSHFCLLRPITTISMVLGRMLGVTSILLFASLCLCVGSMLGADPMFMGQAVRLACLMFAVSWFILHAWLPVVFVMGVAHLLAVPVILLLMYSGAEAEDFDWLMGQAIAAYGVILLFVLYMAIVVVARRLVPAWMVLVSGLATIGIPLAMIVLGETPAIWIVAGDMLIFLPVALLGPVLWQIFWLHRCRHGGLGWRFWRG